MEDLDGDRAGSGCMWGEVNTTIHQRLGCLGTITNGSVRDVDDNVAGFQILAGVWSPPAPTPGSSTTGSP